MDQVAIKVNVAQHNTGVGKMREIVILMKTVSVISSVAEIIVLKTFPHLLTAAPNDDHQIYHKKTELK